MVEFIFGVVVGVIVTLVLSAIKLAGDLDREIERYENKEKK